MINEKWAGWGSNEFYTPQILELFKSRNFQNLASSQPDQVSFKQ
jgi:hypothetical protein